MAQFIPKPQCTTSNAQHCLVITYQTLTENAAFNADNLLLLGPAPADADTVDEYEDKLLAEPIGPHTIEPEVLKRNKWIL